MAPQRRQSIAANPTVTKPRSALGKKRSASIAPGETTALAPRKSILKSAFTFNIKQSGQDSVSFPTTASLDDDDESNENATDYTTGIHDGIGRKSIGRRVSFAPQAHVRLFQTNEQNTNSSGAPSSSPTPSSPARSETSQSPSPAQPRIAPPQLSNENDYPGRKDRNSVGPSLRRQSTLSDQGEMSMSMDIDDGASDPPQMQDFLPGNADPRFSFDARHEYDFDEEDEEDDEDMEITEAIALNLRRKQSLSLSHQQTADRRMSRRRSSFKPTAASSRRNSVAVPEGVGNDSVESSEANESRESDSPMEFTVPLDSALSKPKPPSDAWLALQAVANSSTNENEEQDIELASALSRLQKARESLSLPQNEDGSLVEDDSFTNTDDSADSIDMGDRTLNVTNILGRVRDMEISEGVSVTGGDENISRRISQIRPRDSETEGLIGGNARLTPSVMGVFSAPQSNAARTSAHPSAPLTKPAQEDGTPQRNLSAPTITLTRAQSPSVFSAAKSPVSVSPAPDLATKSPSRPASSLLVNKSTPRTSRSPSPSQPTISSLAKRRATASIPEESQPSPSKKRIIGLGLKATETQGTPSRASTSPAKAVVASQSKSPAPTASKASSTFRRPSGYFAQRRSLLPSAGAQIVSVTTQSTLPTADPSSSQSDGASSSKTTPQVASRPPSPSKPSTPRPRASLPAITATAVKRAEVPKAPRLSSLRPPLIKVKARGQVEGIVEEDENDDAGDVADMNMEDIPPISIEQFFAMTGVKFMDELTIPRRQSMHPSQLRNRRDSEPIPTPSISELAEALHVSIPQLELYSWVAKDLQTWIANSKQIYAQAEAEVAEVVPLLFREFSVTNEEERATLLHQLKLIKANKHGAAKEQWYNWKYQWIVNLHDSAEKGHSDLEADKAVLDDIISRANSLLPALSQQHAQIINELEQEQKEVEDIQNSNPVYLEELKSTITEQNALLDIYRTDIAEGTTKLERLNEKLADMDAQKRENEEAISESQRIIQLYKNSTRAAVFRLKDELESLQTLHSWRTTKVQPKLLELVYNDQFSVSIPCNKYRPSLTTPTGTNGIRISRLISPSSKHKDQDRFLKFSDYVLLRSQELAACIQAKTTKEIIQQLSDFWTSCAQIRTQFTLLDVKFPLAVTADPSSANVLVASASLLFRKKKSKALVSFIFDDDTLSRWPCSIQSLKSEVNIVYGSADSQVIRAALKERLNQASAEDNHACLLDACVEATSRYD